MSKNLKKEIIVFLDKHLYLSKRETVMELVEAYTKDKASKEWHKGYATCNKQWIKWEEDEFDRDLGF